MTTSVATRATSTTVSAAASCAKIGNTEFDPDDELDVLLDALDASKAIGGPVGSASASLLAEVTALDPSARYAYEALGRTRLDGGEPFIDWMRALVTNCGFTASKVEDAIELLDKFSPSPGGVLKSNSYGRCSAEGALGGGRPVVTPGPRQVVSCPGGAIDVIDLDTGVVTRLSGLAAGWWITSDGLAVSSIDLTTKEAQGLTEPSWSATVEYRSLDGKTSWSLLVARDLPGNTPERAVRVLYADATREVDLVRQPISTTDPDEHEDVLTVRDASGKTVASHRVSDLFGGDRYRDGDGGAELAPGPVLLFDYPNIVMLDVTTGKVVLNAKSDTSKTFMDSVCEDNVTFSFRDYGGPTRYFRFADGQPPQEVATRTDVKTASGFNRDATVEAGTLWNQNGGLSLVGLDGTVKWTLPETVVSSFDVVGDWVIVTNRSGQRVIVDPTTGKEAGLPASDKAALIELAAGGIEHYKNADPLLTTVGVDGGAKVQEMKIATLCNE